MTVNKQYYYNIYISSDTPYLLEYELVELEKLGNKFVILDAPMNHESYIKYSHNKYFLINLEYLKSLVLQYKKQIYEEKQNEIVDPFFSIDEYRYLAHLPSIAESFFSSGLKLFSNGKVKKYRKRIYSEEVLKERERKKKEKQAAHYFNMRVRNILQDILEMYYAKELKIHLKIFVTKANLYNVLNNFTVLKTKSITELQQYSNYNPSFEEEELLKTWKQNPELTLVKSKHN